MIVMDCSVEACPNVVNNYSSALYPDTNLRICAEHAAPHVIKRLHLDGDTLHLDGRERRP